MLMRRTVFKIAPAIGKVLRFFSIPGKWLYVGPFKIGNLTNDGL